jgi:hypothetical protein
MESRVSLPWLVLKHLKLWIALEISQAFTLPPTRQFIAWCYSSLIPIKAGHLCVSLDPQVEWYPPYFIQVCLCLLMSV